MLNPSESLRSATMKLTGGHLSLASIALVSTLLSARLIGPEGRGLYTISTQVGLVCSLLCLGGLDVAVMRTTSDDLVPWLGATLLIRLAAVSVVGLLTSIGLGLVAANYALVPLFGLGLCIGGVGVRMAKSLGVAQGRTGLYVGQAVGMAVTTLAITALLFALRLSDWRIWTLAVCIVQVLGGIRIMRKLHSRRLVSGQARPKLDGFAKTAWTYFPVSIGQLAALRLDRLLVGLLAGPAAAGIYAVSSTVAEVAASPGVSLADVSIPRSAANARFRTGLRWAPTAALFSAILTFFGLRFLPVLVGARFDGGLRLAVPLSVGSGIWVLFRNMQARTIAAGRSADASRTELISAGAALGLGLITIPAFGMAAAGWSSSVGYLIGVIVAASNQWRRG